MKTSFDVTTKPDIETTLVIGCKWKFSERLFKPRRFHDVVTTWITSRCRHNVSTTFATSKDVRKTFIYNQIFMLFRRRVSTGDVLPSGKVTTLMWKRKINLLVCIKLEIIVFQEISKACPFLNKYFKESLFTAYLCGFAWVPHWRPHCRPLRGGRPGDRKCHVPPATCWPVSSQSTCLRARRHRQLRRK